MPHKRAKKSARLADRQSKGTDLAPRTNDAELRDMPKGAMRILNAAKVQEDYNRKKKQRQLQDREKAQAKTDEQSALRIKPGEKLSDFSRRVESSMASEVHAKFKATRESGQKRKRRKEDDGATTGNENANSSGEKRLQKDSNDVDKKALKEERELLQARMTKRDVDFEKASQRKRINDVVQAPPSLTKAPRGQSAEALRRKAQLKAILNGRDSDSLDDVQSSSKARIPEGVQQAMSLRRQVELEQEREKAVKAYRAAKEERIKEREARQANS